MKPYGSRPHEEAGDKRGEAHDYHGLQEEGLLGWLFQLRVDGDLLEEGLRNEALFLQFVK
jgi:hypothetical protein